jgi:hypothetical protein
VSYSLSKDIYYVSMKNANKLFFPRKNKLNFGFFNSKFSGALVSKTLYLSTMTKCNLQEEEFFFLTHTRRGIKTRIKHIESKNAVKPVI